MKNREVILSSFIFIFLISFTSALDCPDTDTIFKLSSSTNAHAAIYSDIDYTNDICYSTFFGSYSGDLASVHDCSVGSKDIIVYLSSDSNAHGYSLTGLTSVCYGDLDCTIDSSSGSACSDGTLTAIAFMSSSNNAHLSSVYSTPYNEKICCKKTTPPVTSEYLWKDESGATISTATIGQKVKTTVTNYAGNPDTDFDILEDDPYIPLISDDDDILLNQPGVASGSDWIYEWNILKEDVQKSNDYEEFFFKINGQESPRLSITLVCGDGIMNGIEECDDGNNVNSDGCSSTCIIEQITPVCGNGVKETGEECDDGANNKNTCTVGPSGTCSYCQTNTCKTITIDQNNVYWTDLSSGVITQAYLGQTVRMFYPNGAPRTDKFHVFEDDGPTIPLISSDDEIISKNPSGNQPGYFDGQTSGNNYLATWKITQADLDASDDAGDPPFEFQFEIGQGANKKTSGNLNVIQSPNPINEKLSIDVVNPECGKEFMKDNQVTIEFSVMDPDDPITILSLTVNGVDIPLTIRDDGTYSQVYTLSTPGTIPIRVYAKNERNEEASFVSNIIVISADPADSGKSYVAACIKEPKNFQYITTESVHFDASESKALKYQSGTKTPYKLQDLKFNWRFSDGTTNPNTLGTNSLSYNFYKQFSKFGPNWADVDVDVVVTA